MRCPRSGYPGAAASVVLTFAAVNARAQPLPSAANPGPSAPLESSAAPSNPAATGQERAKPKAVLIRVPEQLSPLLREALIRVRGELSAMGRDAVVISGGAAAGASAELALRAPEAGLLVVEANGSRLRIQAYGPYAAQPIVQEYDASQADVTAEVVAVRTVEALRAALTGNASPAEPNSSAEETPPPAPKPRVKHVKKPQTPAPAAEEEPASSLAPRGLSALSVLGAMAAYLDASSSTTGLGAQVGVLFGRSRWFGGVVGNTTLLPGSIRELVGSVEVQSRLLTGRLGCVVPLDRDLELFALTGAGVAHYSIQGRAEPGYLGLKSEHTSPALAFGLGGTGWFSESVGAYLLIDASLALDAPAVHIADREVAVMERPIVWMSAGLVLQAPRSLWR